jgi:hypothetical protein
MNDMLTSVITRAQNVLDAVRTASGRASQVDEPLVEESTVAESKPVAVVEASQVDESSYDEKAPALEAKPSVQASQVDEPLAKEPAVVEAKPSVVEASQVDESSDEEPAVVEAKTAAVDASQVDDSDDSSDEESMKPPPAPIQTRKRRGEGDKENIAPVNRARSDSAWESRLRKRARDA